MCVRSTRVTPAHADTATPTTKAPRWATAPSWPTYRSSSPLYASAPPSLSLHSPRLTSPARRMRSPATTPHCRFASYRCACIRTTQCTAPLLLSVRLTRSLLRNPFVDLRHLCLYLECACMHITIALHSFLNSKVSNRKSISPLRAATFAAANAALRSPNTPAAVASAPRGADASPPTAYAPPPNAAFPPPYYPPQYAQQPQYPQYAYPPAQPPP